MVAFSYRCERFDPGAGQSVPSYLSGFSVDHSAARGNLTCRRSSARKVRQVATPRGVATEGGPVYGSGRDECMDHMRSVRTAAGFGTGLGSGHLPRSCDTTVVIDHLTPPSR